MSAKFKRTWSIITSVLVFLVCLTAALLMGARLVGFKVYTVLSSSMEPAFHTGSVIYVKEAEPESIKVGDPITFMLSENIVATHRVVEILQDESDPGVLLYRTKGDNNNTVDGGLVHEKNIIGVPKFTIPYLGYVANFIQNPPGKYITLAVGAFILLLAFLPDLFKDDGGKEAKKDEKEEGS